MSLVPDLRICQVEYGGQGGLLRYCATVAAQLGGSQIIVTGQGASADYFPPNAVPLSILPWRGRGGASTAIDIVRSEILLRGSLRRLIANEPTIIHAGLALPSPDERVIHLVHDPDPRPIAGSTQLARWVVRRRERGAGWSAKHEADFRFDRTRRTLGFPLPLGPASFAPRPSSLRSAFGCELSDGSAKILCFGRAATEAGIRTLVTTLSGYGLPNDTVVLAKGRGLVDSDLRQGRIRVVTRRGLVPNNELDALVADSTAVAVPHSSFPRSASGILALAAWHGTNALVGTAVNPLLVHNANRVAVRLDSREEVQDALTKGRDKVDSLQTRAWGVEFAELLVSADV